MDSKTAKINEKQFFEYVNNRDTKSLEDWIDQFVAEEFVNHTPSLDVPKSREGLKEMFKKLFLLFPDIVIVIREMVFEDDILCFRHIIHGMIKNSETIGIAVVKYKNNKITDRWVTIEPV